MSKETYDIVTEVGNFGQMGDIVDMNEIHPDVKKKKKSLEQMIEEANKANSTNL